MSPPVPDAPHGTQAKTRATAPPSLPRERVHARLRSRLLFFLRKKVETSRQLVLNQLSLLSLSSQNLFPP